MKIVVFYLMIDLLIYYLITCFYFYYSLSKNHCYSNNKNSINYIKYHKKNPIFLVINQTINNT